MVVENQNRPCGPSGYGQGQIQPSFVKKFQNSRQLFPEQPEPRLPLVEATQKKGRPSLRSGLNKRYCMPQTVGHVCLDTLEEWYQEANVSTILLTDREH